MDDNLYDHIALNIWPLNSPDLDPLDYFVWCIVEKEVNEHPHNTKDSLKAAIVRLMSGMNKEQLIRACNWFWPRIEEDINARGGFYYHHVAQSERISLTLSPYRPLLQDYIPYRYRAAVCRFESIVQPLLVHVKGSTGVHYLWVRPYFSSSVPHVWFV